MPCRHIALRNGKETGKAGFRCEKIVDIRIELLVVNAIANAEKLPVFVIKEREVHFVRQLMTNFSDAREALRKLVRRVSGMCVDFLVLSMAFGPVCHCLQSFEQKEFLAAKLR